MSYINLSRLLIHLTGGFKDAQFIAKHAIPFIQKIEGETDRHGDHEGVVDMVYFDGASNVQKAGHIIACRFPRISVAHGAEHVVSLFFDNVFTKVPLFKILANFAERVRNLFGSTRHKTTAMFRAQSKKYNKGRMIGFIKVSDCR